MKTNVFLWIILAIAVSFNACNKEESLSLSQEELVPETEQTVIDLNAYAHLEESVQAIIRSLDLSMRGLPANVNEIALSPTGAINPNGESRIVTATGSFTSSILVKAQELNTGNDLVTGTITGNGLMGFTTLAIPSYQAAGNAGNRVVGFYYWGSTNQWELFHFETQAPNGIAIEEPDENFQIPGQNAILAKRDARSEGVTEYETMTFAIANGISISFDEFYNTWNFNDPSEIRYNTGCNAYYEKENGSDRGQWRAPTHAVVEALVNYYLQTDEHPQKTHGMDFLNNYYWMNMNYSTGGGAFKYINKDHWITFTDKKTLYRVRCVRFS